MACYVVKPKTDPSHEEYKTWVMMGYLGSYEQYATSIRERDMSPIHIHGDLGPHCSECAAPGENLCDYPVGDGKTCDRALCDDHAKGVANDTHYCRDHFIMWREYLASNRGYDVLDNVTPLGVAASVDRSPEGGDRETGRHAKHESAVPSEASADAPPSAPSLQTPQGGDS